MKQMTMAVVGVGVAAEFLLFLALGPWPLWLGYGFILAGGFVLLMYLVILCIRSQR